MIALTREPSGRRASTIGDASSTRRPMRRDDLVDDAQQVLVVDELRRSVIVDLAAALDVDVVRAVDHDLGDGVVAQERLERAVAEDVVGDLARDLGALLAGQRRLVEREGLRHRLADALGELAVVGLGAREQPRAEAGDDLVVDAAT